MVWTSSPVKSLKGVVRAPGDKSCSHRALIFGGLAAGTSRFSGLLEGEDVLRTGWAMEALGATVKQTGPGAWEVTGVGEKGLSQPDKVLDFGNSGTGSRLMMGLVSGYPINVEMTGDESLRSRPMNRILKPLRLMRGLDTAGPDGKLPFAIVGTESLKAITYVPPVASAQVKSAVLLAGLNAVGTTIVEETRQTRDHTERMLAGFGAEITTEETGEGRVITLTGQPELEPQSIVVPRDPSSAAFPVCAALITEGSDVLVPNIGLNPTRAGLFTTLREMGADLSYENEREEGGEPVADLRARFSPDMKGIEVPPARAASMIDEYPVLSVVAAFAQGATVMRGVKELRVKESDRIEAMATGLRANGVSVEDGPDWWIVEGRGAGGVPGGAICASHLDHRIAMSFLVMGMATNKPVSVDDGGPIATSFPIFEALMGGLGADIRRG